jgi:hypothetical protein
MESQTFLRREALGRRFAWIAHPMPHGPLPPQREQPPPSLEVFFAVAAPTAKTLSDRAVWVDLQDGQGTFSLEFIDRAKWSNVFLHFWQTYSYMGITISSLPAIIG